MTPLAETDRYTGKHLRVREIEEWPNALNGLQMENSGRVTKIGAAVDVSTRVLSEAAKKDVDLLLVHHGLFWPGLQPVTNALHRQLRIAFENDVALYSAHLPLDIGKVKAFAFGPKRIKTIGIVTGGGGSEIYLVGQEKI